MEGGKHIMLVAQKTAAKDEPTDKDMYEVGCVANILQMLKLPDGTVKVLVEGLQRARTLSIEDQESQFSCDVMPLEPDQADSAETEALRRAIVSQFDQYVKLNKKIPPEILTSLSGIDEAGRLADTIAAHLPLKLDQKQHILEMLPVIERLEHLLAQLEAEIDILQVEKRIRGRVKRSRYHSGNKFISRCKNASSNFGSTPGRDVDCQRIKVPSASRSKGSASSGRAGSSTSI
jgi:ATP-dependent Lon protease